MKNIALSILMIIAAAIGVMFLLKKGGEAGASKVRQIGALPRIKVDAAPIRPQTIEGRIDDFKAAILLKPIRSWGAEVKYGFMLGVSGNPKLNRPTVRVVLAHPTAAPVILEIQYAVAENMLKMIEANPAARDRFDGVAVQVSTEGSNYCNSALLTLEPQRLPEHRRWLNYNLTLPVATREIHFWIAGTPPRYNVFWDNCVISLPQLRITPTRSSNASNAKRVAFAANS